MVSLIKPSVLETSCSLQDLRIGAKREVENHVLGCQNDPSNVHYHGHGYSNSFAMYRHGALFRMSQSHLVATSCR